MNKMIGNKWDELLADEWRKPYYLQLREFLKDEYKNETVYPPAEDIYNALRLTDYDDVRAVILGQDPYHEPGQAQGLAFSVPADMIYPPSLVNILKELDDDLGIVRGQRAGTAVGVEGPEGRYVSAAGPEGTQVNAGYGAGHSAVLEPWARQGVLLLNTVLTVRAHQAGSHRGHGWEQFTDRIIELLAARTLPMVFVLWGANARAKKDIIRKAEAMSASAETLSPSAETLSASAEALAEDRGPEPSEPPASDAAAADKSGRGTSPRRHLIIEAPHPSPLSAYRGFFGGRYFSRCNYFLEDSGLGPIDWSL